MWKYENIEIWKYRNIEIWKYRNIKIWKNINIEIYIEILTIKVLYFLCQKMINSLIFRNCEKNIS
jgi:hypothetical protein